MNKNSLSERDICTKFITLAIQQAGWQLDQFHEEVSLTNGRVMVRGKLADADADADADVAERVAVEYSPYLDADGRLITEDYRVLLRDDIRKALQAEFGSLNDFLRRWNATERKQAMLEVLANHGVPLDSLQQTVADGSEFDAFDLVAHVAFDQTPLTRRERANRVKKRDVFGRYGEQARAVLEALLDKFADHGVQDIEDARVLELPPFDQFGTKTQIRRGIFGGVEQYEQPVRALEQALYDAPEQKLA
jgi:type I restriction enzyme, R subunit